MSCDNCNFVIDSISVWSWSISELVKYMNENNWVSINAKKENDYKMQNYCPKCAVALGINKDI
jgi:rubredoxin